jgi:hypothetical protein
MLRNSVYERVNSLISGTTVVVPPPAPEEAATTVTVPSQQEPLMVLPLIQVINF